MKRSREHSSKVLWRGLWLVGLAALIMTVWSGYGLADEIADTTQQPVPGDGSSSEDCVRIDDGAASDDQSASDDCPDQPKPPSDDSGGTPRPPGDGGTSAPPGAGGDGGGDRDGGETPPSGGGEHATAPPSDSGSGGSGGTGGEAEDGTEEMIVPGVILGKSGSGTATKRGGAEAKLDKLALAAADEDLRDIVAGGEDLHLTGPVEEDPDLPVVAAPEEREVAGGSGPLALTGVRVAIPLLIGALLIVGGWLLLAAASRREYRRLHIGLHRYYLQPTR